MPSSFALIRNQALAIESILNANQLAAGRAEVHQNPGAHAAQLRDAVEHRELMLEEAGLVFLGPAIGFRAVQAGLGAAAKVSLMISGLL